MISNQGVALQAQDAKVVGELKENLISVRKPTKAGGEVSFDKQVATLKKDGQLIASAFPQGIFYKLKILPVVARASSNLQ